MCVTCRVRHLLCSRAVNSTSTGRTVHARTHTHTHTHITLGNVRPQLHLRQERSCVSHSSACAAIYHRFGLNCAVCGYPQTHEVRSRAHTVTHIAHTRSNTHIHTRARAHTHMPTHTHARTHTHKIPYTHTLGSLCRLCQQVHVGAAAPKHRSLQQTAAARQTKPAEVPRLSSTKSHTGSPHKTTASNTTKVIVTQRERPPDTHHKGTRSSPISPHSLPDPHQRGARS
jgi:ribosomal protein L37E